MKLPLYIVDAFTRERFGGNPAAVCLLESWLPDTTLQSIATENNLSETAFVVPEGSGYQIRWFTPVAEVDLCGHATLATAYVLLNTTRRDDFSLTFSCARGPLDVFREGNRFFLDFPATPPRPLRDPEALHRALGCSPRESLIAREMIAVFDSEEEVRALAPDMQKVALLDALGVIATAPGESCDYVCRCFFPKLGIPEDPVTGSAQCSLVPYWSLRLDRAEMRAQQISARGGSLICRPAGDRVLIGGEAVLYLEGTIEI